MCKSIDFAADIDTTTLINKTTFKTVDNLSFL